MYLSALAIGMIGLGPLDLARSAYKEGRYFDLVRMDRQSLPSPDRDFFEGFVELGLSNLEPGLKHLEAARKRLSGEWRKEAYENLLPAQARSGRYREAAGTARQALADASLTWSTDEKKSFRNQGQLWGALASVPPMKVEPGNRLPNPSKPLPFFEVGFWANGRTFNLACDSGANISLVRENLGKAMGLRMIPTKIHVGSITGDSVQPWLGVADRLDFGNLAVRNAVFLVMRDKDLYFPEAKFQLDGVIGLPVMMALQRGTFFTHATASIPGPAGSPGPPNLFIAGLKVYTEGTYKGQNLTFALDSGAGDTILYPPFLKRFRKEIEARGFPRPHKVMGVAGAKDTEAFMLTAVSMRFGTSRVIWPTVDVIGQKREEASGKFYGNLGRDMLGQFESVTFDWKRMRMDFGPKLNSSR